MAKNKPDDLFVKENHKRDRRKHHKNGFNENQDVQTKRHARIHFKSYLRDLEEQSLSLDDWDDDDCCLDLY